MTTPYDDIKGAPAIELALPYVQEAEGYRALPYDDATGQTVTAPKGDLSWLYGVNLTTQGTPALGTLLTRYTLCLLHAQLMALPWYVAAGPVRQSVFLNAAYNLGLSGLLHGYPLCIAAAEAQDWTDAADQLTVSDPDINSNRYGPLRVALAIGRYVT